MSLTASNIARKDHSSNVVNRVMNREYDMPVAKRTPSWISHRYIDHHLEHADVFDYKYLRGHYGCVNTVEFSPDGDLLASGSDDKRVLLWKVCDAIYDSKYEPDVMVQNHQSNIFSMVFDKHQPLLYSGGNDEQLLVHDIKTKKPINMLDVQGDVYGLSADPSTGGVFASAAEDITLWDLRAPNKAIQVAISPAAAFHAVVHNPVDHNLLVTANSRYGIDLYDIRKPLHRLFRYYSPSIIYSQRAMSVQYSRTGQFILALRPRMSPVLYNSRSPYPVAEFEADDYYNSCTLKSCCFVGKQDQFIASGSDNFKIFMWRIDDCILDDSNSDNPLKRECIHFTPKPCQVFNTHRSIVNQVRYCDKHAIIASAGVEKIIKLWSPFPLPGDGHRTGFVFKTDTKQLNITQMSRPIYSYRDHLNILYSDRDYMAHDYSRGSLGEDIRMIAYFDSLIERDLSSAVFGSSSSEDESPSYFGNILNRRPRNEHLADLKPEEDNIEFVGNSSDSDDRFYVQKMVDFSATFDENKLNDDEYLSYIFAKRIHARYICSFVDHLITRLSSSNLPTMLTRQTSHHIHSACPESSSDSSSDSSDHFGRYTHGLDLNQRIFKKKEISFAVFACKFVKSLLLSFYHGALFDSKSRFLHKCNYVNDKELVNSSLRVQQQIRTMCKYKDKHLCDKRLHAILNGLYKKVLELNRVLNNSHCELKEKCDFYFLKQSHYVPAWQSASNGRSLHIERVELDDNEVSLDLDEERSEESSDGLDCIDLSSDSELDSSSSQSIHLSDDSDSHSDEEQQSERLDSNNSNWDSKPTPSLAENELDPQQPSTSSALSNTSTTAETEEGSSGRIVFKKIDRTNRNYKQSRTIASSTTTEQPNKRQRRSSQDS